MFIAYATAPGRTASDKGDTSGPYAAALAEEFGHPGLDHLNFFQNVKEAVLQATGGAQQPWESNGIGRRVYLTGRMDDPKVAAAAEAQREFAVLQRLEAEAAKKREEAEAAKKREEAEAERQRLATLATPIRQPRVSLAFKGEHVKTDLDGKTQTGQTDTTNGLNVIVDGDTVAIDPEVSRPGLYTITCGRNTPRSRRIIIEAKGHASNGMPATLTCSYRTEGNRFTVDFINELSTKGMGKGLLGTMRRTFAIEFTLSGTECHLLTYRYTRRMMIGISEETGYTSTMTNGSCVVTH